MEQNILIISSLKEHPEQLCDTLAERGLSITLVQDVQSAVLKLQSHVSAFLVLDLGLDGALPFIKEVMRTYYDPPPYVIAADAFSCSMAQAEILNLGADVCVGKPFDKEEIVAVVNAAIRRTDRLAHSKPLRTAPPIDRGKLHIDQLCRHVTMDDKEVHLTVKEYDILCFLATYPGTVFSKAQIYERVWGEDYEFASTSVSDLISSLRKKLGLNPREGHLIQTIHGIGYRFVDPK